MPRDEIVEVIAHAIEDWVENSVDYELSRAAAESALAALIETCPLVAGLIDDPDGIAGAVRTVVDWLPNEDYAPMYGLNVGVPRKQVGTVSAWLTGAGKKEDANVQG
jgi:hypothetical protein